MDAFRNPQVKSTEDLFSAFLYYMRQACLVTQEDVDRFWAICEELYRRKGAL